MAFNAASVVAFMRGILSAHETGGDAVGTYALRPYTREYTYTKDAADAMAGDATVAHAVLRILHSGTITAIKLIPTGAVTAGATHFSTLTLARRPLADPGTPVTIATRAWSAGNSVAFTEEDLTIASAAVLAGDVITFAISKTMNGLAIPASTVQITVVET
jgi:hypothetical protein